MQATMRTGTTTRTNYSPVRQMSRILQDHSTPPMELQAGQRNVSSIGNYTVGSQDNENTLEEVYICSCCGVTSELTPGIKFMQTFKSLFFLFNFLVFAFGLANFGMGLWLRIDPKIYEIHKYIATQNFTIAGWILLFCGFFACIMALTGFIASGRQVTGLLACYLITMIALTLAFVGTLVLLTVYGLGQPLEDFMEKEIYEQIRRKFVSMKNFENSNAAEFLDFIQVKMRCCGAKSFDDYGKQGLVVPTTCYSTNKNYILAEGCGRAIRQLLDLRAGLALGFTSGSVVVQLLTIILSALMFCSIYHWRAHPRPATPQSLRSGTPIDQANVQQEAYWHANHQRPRSRTPIII